MSVCVCVCVPTGPALITAGWPASGSAVCHTALAHYETLQGVVKAVRNARVEFNVEVRAGHSAKV